MSALCNHLREAVNVVAVRLLRVDEGVATKLYQAALVRAPNMVSQSRLKVKIPLFVNRAYSVATFVSYTFLALQVSNGDIVSASLLKSPPTGFIAGSAHMTGRDNIDGIF